VVPDAGRLRHHQQIFHLRLRARNAQQAALQRPVRRAEDAVLVQLVLGVDAQMHDAAALVREELDGVDELADLAEGLDGPVGRVAVGDVLVERAVVRAQDGQGERDCAVGEEAEDGFEEGSVLGGLAVSACTKYEHEWDTRRCCGRLTPRPC